MYDLRVTDVAYTATSLDELRGLLSANVESAPFGEDTLYVLSEDGRFDFTALDPRVVELVYGMGRWWNCRGHAPGVVRLRAEIARGRLPALVVWEVEETSLRCGVEYGAGFEMTSSIALVEDQYTSSTFTACGYELCLRVGFLLASGKVPGAVSGRFRELVEEQYVPYLRELFDRQWPLATSYNGFSVIRITWDHPTLLDESVKFLVSKHGMDWLDYVPWGNAPDATLYSMAVLWELLTGGPSPVIAFIKREGGGFVRVKGPTTQYLLGNEYFFVVDINLDANHPVLVHLRKEFP